MRNRLKTFIITVPWVAGVWAIASLFHSDMNEFHETITAFVGLAIFGNFAAIVWDYFN